MLGREGANITIHRPGGGVETGGEYGAEGFVYQELADLFTQDGMFAIAGSWVIGHDEGDSAAGIGVRESSGLITTNTSSFVPHRIE